MDLPLIGSYDLEAKPHSVQRTVNLIPVPQEPGNERTAWVLKDVKGLETFVALVDPTPADPVPWDRTSSSSAQWTYGTGDRLATMPTFPGIGYASLKTTVSRSSGKRYFEITVTHGFSYVNNIVGISSITKADDSSPIAAEGCGYALTGAVSKDNVLQTTIAAIASGDVVMCAVNFTTNEVWFGKNGAWATGNPASGTSPTVSGLTPATYAIAASMETGTNPISFLVNGGDATFAYAPPFGFDAWGAP